MHQNNIKDFIQKEIIPHLIQTENLNAIWNKLFERELIKKYSISYLDTTTLSIEEIATSILHQTGLRSANKID